MFEDKPDNIQEAEIIEISSDEFDKKENTKTDSQEDKKESKPEGVSLTYKVFLICGAILLVFNFIVRRDIFTILTLLFALSAAEAYTMYRAKNQKQYKFYAILSVIIGWFCFLIHIINSVVRFLVNVVVFGMGGSLLENAFGGIFEFFTEVYNSIFGIL